MNNYATAILMILASYTSPSKGAGSTGSQAQEHEKTNRKTISKL